jgi:hypothetical protein
MQDDDTPPRRSSRLREIKVSGGCATIVENAASPTIRYDVWLLHGLSPRVLERLADADAFGSRSYPTRRWKQALGRVGDRDDDLRCCRRKWR